MPAAVHEARLGHRSGCPEVLRHRFLGPRAPCGAGGLRLPVGAVVCEAVAGCPLKHHNGVLEQRSKGTPQGSAVSPVLANLFMHYAFDLWMAREFSGLPVRALRRRCDRALQDAAPGGIRARQDRERMSEVGLTAAPQQDEVVYCKDSNRQWYQHEHTSFTFLGFCLPSRMARTRTAVSSPHSCLRSARALKAKSSGFARCESTGAPPDARRPGGVAEPIIAGWMNYYGRFYRSALYSLLRASTPM